MPSTISQGAPWPRNRIFEYSVEFTSPAGEQYNPAWIGGLVWSTYYSEKGSGFGALTVKFARPVGYDYQDLAFSYDVVVRYGLETILFDGQVRQIQEGITGGINTIEVTALGWGVVFGDDKLNWVFCDTRAGQWTSDPEASGSYRPDRFALDQYDRLFIGFRSRQFYETDDYAAWRYTLPAGQVLARVSATWELNIPDDWGATASLRVVTGEAEALLSQSADGSGTMDENVATGSPTWVEFRLVFTGSDGTVYAIDESDDGITWGKLTDVVIYAESTENVTGQTVFNKLVAVASQSEHGMDDSTARIEDPGLVLRSVAFETDMALEDIATWVCQFGDADNRMLAWGVAFDADRTIFLEVVDKTTVGYLVPRAAQVKATTMGDWSESYQKRYAVYTDPYGQVVRTADVEDEETIEALGGYARRADFQVSVATDSGVVDSLLALAIAEGGPIATKSSVEVSGFVLSANGGEVFCELMRAGKMVVVEDFRAREAALEPVFDLSDTYTAGLATIVEVDAIRHVVRISLGTEADTLDRFLAFLGELRGHG